MSHFGKEVVASPGPAQTTERRQGPGFLLFALRPRRHLGNGLENRQARKRLVGSNPTPSAFWEEISALGNVACSQQRRAVGYPTLARGPVECGLPDRPTQALAFLRR